MVTKESVDHFCRFRIGMFQAVVNISSFLLARWPI